jgi:manganese transport protein
VFHSRGISSVEDISQAYQLLTPVMGAGLASVLFAVALLCSGQNSTLTGTLAGQICMEGFLHWRLTPWLRRLITRSLAIIPAALVIGIMGENHVTGLLILSQVILSFQLPFAIVPLVQFTSDPAKMGVFANRRWVSVAAWIIAAAVIILNLLLLVLILR